MNKKYESINQAPRSVVVQVLWELLGPATWGCISTRQLIQVILIKPGMLTLIFYQSTGFQQQVVGSNFGGWLKFAKFEVADTSL